MLAHRGQRKGRVPAVEVAESSRPFATSAAHIISRMHSSEIGQAPEMSNLVVGRMSVFGNLRQVDLRDLWRNVASDFTEWLSYKENLDMLAAELKIPLEIVEKEKPVGGFSADLVAKIPDPDSESEEYVVIQNQPEDSDHDHLGKLITAHCHCCCHTIPNR